MLYPNVALPPGKIDAALDNGVYRTDGEPRLRLLRPVVRAAKWQELLGDAVMDQNSPAKPRLCLVRTTHMLLDPESADELTEAQRACCQAVAGSSDVASEMVGWDSMPFALRVVDRNTHYRFTREGDTLKMRMSSGYENQTLTTSTVPSLLLDRLFAPFEDPPQPPLAAKKRTDGSFGLPDVFTQAFATILQDHLRLHVLINGGLPEGVSRPLALNQLTLRKQEDGRTLLMAELHRGSGTCICGAHGREMPDPTGIKVFFEVCGRGLEGDCCPAHHEVSPAKEDPSIGGYCMASPRLGVRCTHFGQTKGLFVKLDILPEALPPLLVLATAASRLVSLIDGGGPDGLQEALGDALEEALDEAEALRLDVAPIADPPRDRLAVHVLRSQLIARGPPRAGNPTLVRRACRGKVEKWILNLAKPYAILFPLKQKKRR